MVEQVINALVTPFDEKGEIDYLVVKKLLQLAEDNCNDALVVGSTTGEGTLLTLEEKKELFSFCQKNTKLKCIYPINQMGLREAKKEFDNVRDLNIEYFLVVTPYYVKPSQEGLLCFYKELAKYMHPHKIILYNVPSRTCVNLSFYTIKKLLKTNDNIIGLKECSNDLNLIYLLKTNFPRFKVFIGDDQYLYEAIKNKADGIISVSSILFGAEMKSVIADYKFGIKSEVVVNYLKLVASMLNTYTNPVGIKHLLEKKGFTSMNVRLPLVKASNTMDNFDILI